MNRRRRSVALNFDLCKKKKIRIHRHTLIADPLNCCLKKVEWWRMLGVPERRKRKKKSPRIPTFSHVSLRTQGGSAVPPGGGSCAVWEQAGCRANLGSAWACLASALENGAGAPIHSSNLLGPGKHSFSACSHQKIERKGKCVGPGMKYLYLSPSGASRWLGGVEKTVKIIRNVRFSSLILRLKIYHEFHFTPDFYLDILQIRISSMLF